MHIYHAIFNGLSKYATVGACVQYDYNPTLRIQGLTLPSAVEVHFSLQDSGGTSVTRIGVTKDGVTDVPIPDFVVDGNDSTKDYKAYAYIYLRDNESAWTEYRITMMFDSRPKPEAHQKPSDEQLFHKTILAVNDSANRSAESEKMAKRWAVGEPTVAGSDIDNAKYYSDQAKADATKTASDRQAVAELVEKTANIGNQVAEVEKLSKEVADNTLKVDTDAKQVSADKQAVDTAKTSVDNAKQSVDTAKTAVDNAKQAVDKAVTDFEQLAQTNMAAINSAGTAQKQAITDEGAKQVKAVQNVSAGVVGTHNTDNSAHNDIRELVIGLTNRINTVLDSTDVSLDQLSEIVAYIKSNKTLIEQVTTNKVNVSDIVTNLTTNVANKPLSASMGVELKKLIDAVSKSVTDHDTSPTSHNDIRQELTTVKQNLKELESRKADAIISTASGENITITDSDNEKLVDFKIFGKSIQNGVPTPTAPVPIVSVGDKGNVKVEVTGKNLADYKKILLGFTKPVFVNNGYVLDACNENTRLSFIELDIPLKKGKTYVLSLKSTKISGKISNPSLFLPEVNQYLNVGKPFSPTSDANKIGIYIDSKNIPTKLEITNIQLEEGTVATAYEPYRESQTLTLTSPTGLRGIKVTCDGNYTDATGQQWLCDEVTSTKRIQRIGQIASYNNEPITTDYISSTGQLSVGAQVNYVLPNPIKTPLTPTEIAEIEKLHSNYPTTIITNDISALMEVAYVADTKKYILNRESAMQKQISDIQKALISQKISGGGYN